MGEEVEDGVEEEVREDMDEEMDNRKSVKMKQIRVVTRRNLENCIERRVDSEIPKAIISWLSNMRQRHIACSRARSDCKSDSK
jgi:hypothetical protein